ncbi:hypothetical protein [Alcaligenes phenolicus]|uniref:hypothetical protein n=1 Tax=Alcaligenes TaxID=507 RepID=UPI0009F61553|nr:hypothetical protein [Alcaligenes phenolicus]OQV33466.1 hypothetical protein BV899_05210 [Alcaligenes phenolicus]
MTNQAQNSPIILHECTVLGAPGFPFLPGDSVNLVFEGDTVSCNSATRTIPFSLIEVADLSVNGPGTVVSGGGFIGGGFDVDGALTGMAIAGVLNALTSKKTTQTFIVLTTNFGELHLHYSLMEPTALRIFLGGIFVRLRFLNTQWRHERARVIEDQLISGTISDAEAETFKARLLSSPNWPDPALEAEQARRENKRLTDLGPKGTCPNCDQIIPLLSETCPHCRANFGEYASRSVIPLKA